MSKEMFTPGEWLVGKPYTIRSKEFIPICVKDGTTPIATITTIAATVPLNNIITEEDWANANLFAASKDMYAALVALSAVVTESDMASDPANVEKVCALALAALHKAEGGKP